MSGMEYYFEVGGKLFLCFIFVLIFFQFSGAKRQFSQMTSIDLISNFILGGLLGGFLYNSNISFVGFLFVLSTYFLIIYFIHLLTTRTNWGRRLIVGVPTIIIENGKINIERLQKLKISMTDIMSLLRSKDIHSLTEIKLAQMEVGGSLTIVKKGEEDYAILLIDNGVINSEGLEQLKKDEKWLTRELKKHNVTDIKEVFCAQWLSGKFYIVRLS